MTDNAVVRKSAFMTNARAKELATEGIRRAAAGPRKHELARAADVRVRTVEKWLAEVSLPDVDCLLNMADVDPEVLRLLFAEKGWTLSRSVAAETTDFELAAHMGSTLSEFLERLRDGKICHVDQSVLATLFRRLIPEMQAIVDQDDARKIGPRVVNG